MKVCVILALMIFAFFHSSFQHLLTLFVNVFEKKSDLILTVFCP